MIRMMNQHDPASILQYAMSALGEAELETDRPEEDVVTCLVCSKLRDSASDFLKYYLKISGINPQKEASIADLKNQCAQFNPAFNDIDIANIECFNIGGCDDNSSFCHDITKVNYCFSNVYELKELVFKAAQSRSRTLA